MTDQLGLGYRAHIADLMENLCKLHAIDPVPRLEWSSRMRRSLGKAILRTKVIRLSAWLDRTQALETIRHELAHFATGQTRRPHGQSWKKWAVALGASPRALAKNGPSNAPGLDARKQVSGLECPSCNLRVVRSRIRTGLYCVRCGPKFGRLLVVQKGSTQLVEEWAASTVPIHSRS